MTDESQSAEHETGKERGGAGSSGESAFRLPPSALRPIYAAIPHREPFLMVDEILEQEPARIVCTKRFSGQEDFFTGHYPNMPLVPGVLLCEAAMQAGAILLAAQLDRSGGKVPVVTRINDVRFKRIVRPGETIRIEVELVERLADAFFLKAKAAVDGKLAMRCEFACTAAEIEVRS
ncbi:MAG: 3-hydroxyacyl-ACP dehydratase FabZ [Thermoguttaceae bacterium]